MQGHVQPALFPPGPQGPRLASHLHQSTHEKGLTLAPPSVVGVFVVRTCERRPAGAGVFVLISVVDGLWTSSR
jgi:hypothetical protein